MGAARWGVPGDGAREGLIGFAGNSRRIVSATAGCHFLFARKVTKTRAARARAGAAHRCPVLLGESGDGAELATLKHRRLFALIPPAMLGSLKADPTSRATAAPVDPRHAWMLLILTFQSALSEPSTAGPARAKRCGCLSAASSRAVLDGPRRRAPACKHAGSRPAERFFGYFLCAQSDTPPRNDPPGGARRYQCGGARLHLLPRQPIRLDPVGRADALGQVIAHRTVRQPQLLGNLAGGSALLPDAARRSRSVSGSACDHASSASCGSIARMPCFTLRSASARFSAGASFSR